MVNTYDNRIDGNKKLSAHFRVREFAEAGTDRVLIDDELVERLEKLYTRLNCSKIIITSGFRTDSTTSQHAKGKATDINCWYKADGREQRYQGQAILLAAQDVGFRGIGWIAGSPSSRAGVHVDTREKRYFFDEANGNRSIGDSWYAFFGLTEPGGSTTENPYAEPTGLLRSGSRGDGVRWVQWQLVHGGHQAAIAIDGIFGAATESAVKEAQRAAGIKADGIVGPDTRAALKKKPDGSTAKNPYAEPAGLLRSGSRGDGVRWVQWQLVHGGYEAAIAIDGVFGAATEAAVKEVQRAAGIKADGIVGPDTRAALKKKPDGSTAKNPYAEPAGLLRSGSRGDGVRWVQWQLVHGGYEAAIAIDGIFGAATESAVKEAQRAAGIKADGIVGPDTIKALKAGE